MSYHRQALGDDVSAALAATLGKISPVVGSAAKILGDPYLPEAACRVAQLHAIENRLAVPSCPTTRAGLTGGIGLRKAMPALRAYVYAERHPVVKPVAVAAAIGLPVLIGYLIGKRK